jgi:hypothetical protein
MTPALPDRLPDGPQDGPPDGPPTTLTLRTPDDLLAVIPVLLGFRAEESLVVLSTGGRAPFTARLDLPAGPDVPDDVVSAVLEPAVRHGVRTALVVALTRRLDLGERTLVAVAAALQDHGVEVRDAVLADGRRWWPAPSGGARGAGRRYDDRAHPFAAAAVLEGRVIYGSREEMQRTLDPDPEGVRRVRELVAAAPGRRRRGADAGAAEERWCVGLVGRCVRERVPPTDQEAARLLVGLEAVGLRDAVWTTMSRSTARDHLDLWREVTVRAPEELRATPAALTGFAAWLTGNGALAWVAVDAALAVRPAHRLARLLGESLAAALPPTAWDQVRSAATPARPP